MEKVRLNNYFNKKYNPGSVFKRFLWYITNVLFFKSSVPYPYFLKLALLRIFGAKVGKRVVIKPCVNIKYPWFLKIGKNSWIGENVWIDNLADVIIGKNACISQGAMLVTGNHNYKKQSFDLILGKIILEEGVWIGAKALVCPGVICKSHSVLTTGSVATENLMSYGIYQGNPAQFKKKRVIES